MSSHPFPAEPARFGAPPVAARGPADLVLLALLGLAIVFHFVVRGWLGASLILAGLYCAGCCAVHHREVRLALRSRQIRWLAVAMAAPMVAAIAANAFNHELVPRSFDAAFRLLLALAVFLELRRRRLDFAPVASHALPVSIGLCTALVVLPSSATFYWDGRFATYFIDPIVLCQQLLIAAFLCLFLIDRRAPGNPWQVIPKVLAIGLAIFVALGTQSRGGWIIVPILATVWLLRDRRVTLLQVTATFALVLLACGLAYWGSSVIRMRLDQVGIDVTHYLDGSNRDTSVGLRLSLFRTALVLFAERPWAGWGFAALPDIRALPDIAPFYSASLQSYFVGAGVHNEFLQAMVRMGIAGLVSRVLMYAVPGWIFIRACRAPSAQARRNGYLGLVVVVGYVTAGLTSEVTNLIYAASFYALLVAVFAAGALPLEAAGSPAASKPQGTAGRASEAAP